MLRLFPLLFSLLFLASCDPDGAFEDTDSTDVSFDRKTMLASWMDNVFIPNQENTLERLKTLQADLRTGEGDGSIEQATESFEAAYLAWQRQSPFILADGEAIRLREQTNTYPTNVELILINITAGTVNLELPSMMAAQGLPALEYLLYGGENREPISGNDQAVWTYAVALADRLVSLHEAHLTALENGREAYINNDGSSATASIDRTVNDLVFNYEKFLRAGKVGIPAGIFSDDPLPHTIESRYRGNSKALFLEALNSSRDFFNLLGLPDYLAAFNDQTGSESISNRISNQYAEIARAALDVEENFGLQIEADNTKMLVLYDEMQKLTILYKVDMLQALSINVDYVDADGD